MPCGKEFFCRSLKFDLLSNDVHSGAEPGHYLRCCQIYSGSSLLDFARWGLGDALLSPGHKMVVQGAGLGLHCDCMISSKVFLFQSNVSKIRTLISVFCIQGNLQQRQKCPWKESAFPLQILSELFITTVLLPVCLYLQLSLSCCDSIQWYFLKMSTWLWSG